VSSVKVGQTSSSAFATGVMQAGFREKSPHKTLLARS
jgi:hypothetical protein